MARILVAGKERCDKCGKIGTDVWNVMGKYPGSGYQHLCNRCEDQVRKEKAEKDNQKKEMDELRKKQSSLEKELKESRSSCYRDTTSSNSNSSGTGIGKILLWVFVLWWVYLLYYMFVFPVKLIISGISENAAKLKNVVEDLDEYVKRFKI